MRQDDQAAQSAKDAPVLSSQIINHEGHEVSRRATISRFPSCAFMPFVVYSDSPSTCEKSRPGCDKGFAGAVQFNPSTTKDMKYHEGLRSAGFPSCAFVSFVVYSDSPRTREKSRPACDTGWAPSRGKIISKL